MHCSFSSSMELSNPLEPAGSADSKLKEMS